MATAQQAKPAAAVAAETQEPRVKTVPVEAKAFKVADMPKKDDAAAHPFGVTALDNPALGTTAYRVFNDRFHCYVEVKEGDVLVRNSDSSVSVYTLAELKALEPQAKAFEALKPLIPKDEPAPGPKKG